MNAAAMAVLTLLLAGLADEPKTVTRPPVDGKTSLSDIIGADGKVDPAKAAALGLTPKDIEMPVLKKRADPAYPDLRAHGPKNAHVLFDCRLDVEGVLRDCRVLESSGTEFTREAEKAVSRWRYSPLRVRKEPREVDITIGITFNVVGR